MDKLIEILDELTVLTKDTDLFAYEIPLEKGGLWLADSQTDSRFNDSDAVEFDCYYRGKDKVKAIANIQYLKSTIDALSGSMGVCLLDDGTNFSLKIMYKWDYLEKDAEGYFVFANRLRLIYDEPEQIISA